MPKEWRRSVREQAALAVLLLDLDNFKQINDRYGHQAGDRCLRSVGEHLQSVSRRAGITAARYGGEEFALLLTAANSVGAAAFGEEIRKQIEALDVEELSGKLRLTTSVGVATDIPSAAGSAEELVAYADRALYRAKQAGRNQTWLYDAAARTFRKIGGRESVADLARGPESAAEA